MALQVVHARVSLPDGTTFEDTASIGFTFQAVTATAIAPADIYALIDTYFNTRAGTATVPLSAYISPEVSRASNGCSIAIYDVTDNLGGAPVGSPLGIGAFTMGAAVSSVALPAQLAAVCAFRAAYGTDIEKGTAESAKSDHRAIKEGAPATHSAVSRPRSRDRGRFYLGPLGLNTLQSSITPVAGTAGELSTVFMADLIQFLTNELGTHTGSAGGSFSNVVWSRVAAAVKLVGWVAVDAAMGVIRKRADTVVNRVLSWVPEGA